MAALPDFSSGEIGGPGYSIGRIFSVMLICQLRQIRRRHFHGAGGWAVSFLSMPWQAAQYCVNISFPEVGFVCLIVVALTVGF
jgi:hypothetical protein